MATEFTVVVQVQLIGHILELLKQQVTRTQALRTQTADITDIQLLPMVVITVHLIQQVFISRDLQIQLL